MPSRSEPPLLGLSQRLPPQNLQAEQALLGALLVNNKAYDRVAAFLRPEHFADPVNGRIYAAIARRVDAGQLADCVTLNREFAEAGTLDEVGGTAYLTQLLSAMVGIINAAEYGRAIQDCWHRRELIGIGEDLVNVAFAPGTATAREIQEQAEEKLFVLADAEPDGAPVPAHTAMAEAIDAAAKAADRAAGLIGLTTGFAELDDITGGWRRGSYNLLAARPSMGKTTLALAFAVAAAAVEARVLFVSREMRAHPIGAKLVAGMTPIAADAADRGKFRERDEFGRFRYTPITQQDIDRMMAAQRAMARRHLLIDECRAGTVAAIRSLARRQKRRQGLDLLLIDYLGLLKVPELARSDNRTLEVTRLSEQCKSLAADLDIPVIVLAQLNRGPEGREDRRPGLADLRDSGSLEQDADLVAFLYREHYYLTRYPPKRRDNESDEHFANRSTQWGKRERESKGVAEIIIAKQRMGAVGTRRIAYYDSNVWFGDLDGAQ